MPFRALLWTVLTVGIALLAVGMWVGAVERMVAATKSDKSEHVLLPVPATQSTTLAAGPRATPEQELNIVVKGTLLLSFVLICALLVVGFFGTFREWVRFRSGVGKERSAGKTKYVDAWKIAGERLKEKEDGKGSEGPGTED